MMVNSKVKLALVVFGAVVLVVRFNQNNKDFPITNGIRLLTPSAQQREAEKIGAIHVGKCGGVGLRQSLKHPQTKTVLKEKQIRWFHMHNPGNPHKYKTWIVLVRDPIARIQSNYVYEHVANAHLRTDAAAAVPQSRLPNKAKFYECYNTLEKLVTIGLAPDASPSDHIAEHASPGIAAPENDDCRRLAFGLFDGPTQHVVPGMPHFSFNYEYYTKKLLLAQKNDPEMKIWLIRQEHMQQDVDTIDRALGGRGVVWHVDHFNHVDAKGAKEELKDSPGRQQLLSKHMSPAGLRNLCRVLCDEIQYYKALVAQAEHKDGSFVEETLAPLEHKCPEQVKTSVCESAIPPVLRAKNRATLYKQSMLRSEGSESKATIG